VLACVFVVSRLCSGCHSLELERTPCVVTCRRSFHVWNGPATSLKRWKHAGLRRRRRHALELETSPVRCQQPSPLVSLGLYCRAPGRVPCGCAFPRISLLSNVLGCTSGLGHPLRWRQAAMLVPRGSWIALASVKARSGWSRVMATLAATRCKRWGKLSRRGEGRRDLAHTAGQHHSFKPRFTFP